MSHDLNIPYCPNCRRKITDKSVGWQCWKANVLSSDELVDLSAIKDEDGASQFEGENEDSDTFFQLEDSLCLKINHWSETACTKCKEPRARGEFRHYCLYASCYHEIPDLRDVDARTITVSGPSGAGKTTYVVALYEWWKENLAYFGLTRIPAMGERLNRHFKSQRDQLLKKKIKLPATDLKKMISYSWQILGVGDRRGKGMLVTLPDVSGERLMRLEYLAASRYYHYTSGIIFLLDADRLLGLEDGRSAEEHGDVALAMVEDLKRRLGDEETARIPLAVCVNKIDKLRVVDPRWAKIQKDHFPDHNGRFDMKKCENRSLEIRDLLAGAGDTGNVVSLFEDTFDNIMFFPVATLGSDVSEGQIRWCPVGVEDPFLFLMFHLNYVK